MKTKRIQNKMTVAAAISAAHAEIETLTDELQNWYDNMPESFQNGSKGDELTDALDTLGNTGLDNLEIPLILGDVEITVTDNVPYGRRSPSRSLRANNSAGYIRNAANAAESWLDENLELSADDVEEGETAPTEEQITARSDQRDEVETFREDAEAAADELEQVNFPGMY